MLQQQKPLGGGIPENLDTEVEFSFPEISPMDRQTLVNVLTTLKSSDWFSEKRCMRLVANAFAATSYDVDSEKQQIQQEKKEQIDRELEENRYRSLAETKLQVWQSYFAHTGAQEEQNQLGYSPTSGDAGASSPNGAGGGGGKPSSGSGGANSGGMSEKDRASVGRGGR